MNPSTTAARALVRGLVAAGLSDVVVSPGSRSAPLAMAFLAAERAGALRLHVRVDERTAAFLALGLGKRSGRAAAVVTTSGTAAVNLHPAVVEASYAEVPLLALTADRPPELRGVGANQTIDQRHLYGGAVRAFRELAVPATDDADVDGLGAVTRSWREAAGQAYATAVGALGGRPGPVHLDVALRDPLLPDDGADADDVRAEVGVRAGAGTEPVPGAAGHLPPRGVVLVGDGAGALAADAAALAARTGWPLVAEPTAWADLGPAARPLRAGSALLASRVAVGSVPPDLVVVVGRPTLSRASLALMRSAAAHWSVVQPGKRVDPVGSVTRTLHAVPAGEVRPADRPAADAWSRAWSAADAAARPVLDDALAVTSADAPPAEPAIAGELVATLPRGALLVAGSSTPVRDVDRYATPRADIRVLANRGAAGIDGTVSTAVGAAIAHGGPAYALLGDLTFLHDVTGLLLGADETRPDLCLVVVNNAGGGIFGLLETGEPQHAHAFERVFRTPVDADIGALCAGSGTPHRRAETVADLRGALQGHGLRVVEMRADPTTDRAVRERLAAAVDQAVERA